MGCLTCGGKRKPREFIDCPICGSMVHMTAGEAKSIGITKVCGLCYAKYTKGKKLETLGAKTKVTKGKTPTKKERSSKEV